MSKVNFIISVKNWMTIDNPIHKNRIFISFTSFKLLGEGFLFLIPLIFAKFISPMEFGSFSLSMMIVFFLSALLLVSSQTPFIVYAAKEYKIYNSIKKSFTNQLILFIISVTFFLLLTLIFNEFFLEFAQITKKQLLFLGLAYFGICLKVTISNTFLALNKRVESSIYEFLTGVIGLFYILFIYACYTITIENIFLLYFVSSTVSTIFMFRKIDFIRILPLSFDKKEFMEVFEFTKWQMISLTAVYLVNWGDNLVLRYFVSIQEIGVYNVGYQIFKGLINASLILYSYFIPFVTQNIDNNEKIKHYLNVKRPKIIFLSFLGIGILFFMAPTIFHLVFGEKYLQSIIVFRILLVGLIPFLFNVFLFPIFHSTKNYKVVQMNNIYIVLLNISLDILFVYYFGIFGAAIATTISYYVGAILLYFKFKKIFGGKYCD